MSAPRSGFGGALANRAMLGRTLYDAGVIRPHHPLHLAQAGRGLLKMGTGFAGGGNARALLGPEDPAIADELGELTWGELRQRSMRLAHGLRDLGVGEGDSVAVLCRNHRYFIEISTAIAQLGADILYLNTSFAAPQLAEICARERPALIAYDDEFAALIDEAGIELPRLLAFTDGPDGGLPTAEGLVSAGPADQLPPPERLSRPVILTSGTTGAPKGAPRSEAGLDAAAALLSRMPFKAGSTVHIAAPMFHTWGWAHLAMSMLLGTKLVLSRRFDPAESLRLVERHRCDSMIVIPVMLQRILRLPQAERSGDYSSLQVVAASGSALPGDLATDWMDHFGENLYNTYGSTEVAWATIAQPQEMRSAPGTAGRAPFNTQVRIYDAQDRQLPPGEPGRIFVGNSMLFAGYTDGGRKQVIDGLMATGDVGRLDESGLLFVEGRDDEMIVSGGENVFPQEVEDCLSRHPAVQEAAAIGVPDPDFGSRLRAFVVRSGQVDEGSLKDWVRTNLARYKVPREVVFLDELPRNATGKILKRVLVDYEASS